MAGARKRSAGGPQKPTRPGRRRRLLDAAAAAFRRHGYAAADYAAVAAAAKIPLAAAVKLLPDKPALLAELFAEFRAAALAPPGGDVAALADQFRKAAKAFPAVLPCAAEVLGGPDGDARRVAADGVQAAADAVADLIRTGQAAGVVRRALDPAAAGREWVRYLVGAELLRAFEAGGGDDGPVADVLVHGTLKTDV